MADVAAAAPGASERSLLAFLDRLEGEGSNARSQKDTDWDRYAQLFEKARPLPGARANRFLANIIRPTLDRRNALITENKPGINIMSRSDWLDTTAKVIDEIITAGWSEWGVEAGLQEMVDYSSVFGCTGVDLPWNSDLQGGLGDIEWLSLDPRACIFDPSVTKARHLQKAQYFRIESIWNLWDVQAKFPGRGMLVRADEGLSSYGNQIRTPVTGQGVVRSIAQSFKARLEKLQQGPIPRVRMREYWLRDPARNAQGDLVFPLGRHILRAGDVILSDGPNPYNDGLWPVEWLDLSPDINGPWGRSEVEALRYLQDAINRIGNLFVENTVLGGNLVVVADADAMNNTQINQLTNAAALIIQKKFGRNVEWRPPPPMPPHMIGFIQFALGLVDYLVGIRDGQLEGRGRVELRSGVQLEGLQTAAQTLVRSAARRIEQMLERVGTKIISRIFQFYTADRMMIYLGPGEKFVRYNLEVAKLRNEIEMMAKREIGDSNDEDALKDAIKHRFENAWRMFAFKITPLSTLAATKVARAQLLKQLVDGGLLPRTVLLQEIGYTDADTQLQKVMEEQQKYGAVTPAPPPKKGKSK